ncbi:HNH endonuclease [Burkholderia gladioli]|uniref:HNH endonuclease n=1 Tax=Burkholderia gladioli TaxID=28095 RepID=UPI0013DDB138|nr:HNH endonuclease [Burkholderia gladioli]
MWIPVTPGEEIFLLLYAQGKDISVQSQTNGLYDSLVAPDRFSQFTRIVAALEITIRTLSAGTALTRSAPDATPNDYRTAIDRNGIELPAPVQSDRSFWESVKLASENILNEPALRDSLEQLKQPTFRNGRKSCYLCGKRFQSGVGANQYLKKSVDHLWPLCLGGSNALDNLVPACVGCNNTRNEAVTWAWGPVQSTRLKKSTSKEPDKDLKLSLGFARMMLYAERFNGNLTLKATLQKMFPACIDLSPAQNKHESYFEIFKRMEDDVWQLRH